MRPALRLLSSSQRLPAPRGHTVSLLSGAGVLVWAICLLVVALVTGIAGAYNQGRKDERAASHLLQQGFGLALIVDSALSRATALNRMADSVEHELRSFHSLAPQQPRADRAIPHIAGLREPPRP